MSIEVSNSSGCLGQFASNSGYTDLIEASQKNPILKKFFLDANTEDVPAIIDALKNLDADHDVLETAAALIDLIEGQKLVFITNGTHDDGSGTASVGKGYGDDAWNSNAADENAPGENSEPDDEDQDVDKFDWEIPGTIIKVDDEKHLVFGWFSVIQILGEHVIDTQGDIITSSTLEEAAYSFVLNARKGGEMHRTGDSGIVRGIGRVVESVVFTKEKQQAMLKSLHDQGINDAVLDLCAIAWWGGFMIENAETWAKVKSGELKAFSIGGKGKRASV